MFVVGRPVGTKIREEPILRRVIIVNKRNKWPPTTAIVQLFVRMVVVLAYLYNAFLSFFGVGNTAFDGEHPTSVPMKSSLRIHVCDNK